MPDFSTHESHTFNSELKRGIIIIIIIIIAIIIIITKIFHSENCQRTKSIKYNKVNAIATWFSQYINVNLQKLCSSVALHSTTIYLTSYRDSLDYRH
jgi:hypothetical protein